MASEEGILLSLSERSASLAPDSSSPVTLEARVRAAAPYVHGTCTLQGPRPVNEDGVLVDAARGHFLVVDGLGGAGRGDLAARIVIECLRDGNGNGRAMLEEANRRIQHAIAEQPDLKGMGATVGLVILQGRQAQILHAGEVRCYLLRRNEAQPLTEDHTLAAQLVKLKQIAPEAAATHPARKTILRYLGKEDGLRLEETSISLEPGDRLLLCSDGFYGHLPLEALGQLGQDPYQLDAALAATAEAAIAAGGQDNASAVLIAEDARPVALPAMATPLNRISRELRGVIDGVLAAADPEGELELICTELIQVSLATSQGTVGGLLREAEGGRLVPWIWQGGSPPDGAALASWRDLVIEAADSASLCAQRGCRIVAVLPRCSQASNHVLALELPPGATVDEALANQLEVAAWIPVMARMVALRKAAGA